MDHATANHHAIERDHPDLESLIQGLDRRADPVAVFGITGQGRDSEHAGIPRRGFHFSCSLYSLISSGDIIRGGYTRRVVSSTPLASPRASQSRTWIGGRVTNMASPTLDVAVAESVPMNSHAPRVITGRPTKPPDHPSNCLGCATNKYIPDGGGRFHFQRLPRARSGTQRRTSGSSGLIEKAYKTSPGRMSPDPMNHGHE